jgi:hypothetical protein
VDQAATIPIATAAPGAGGYPLRLFIDPAKSSMNRLWGIPYFGVLARAILAVPVYLVVVLLGIAVYLTVFVSWIPVLFTGKQAGWVYALFGTYFRWAWRVTAYLLLLVGGYPISDDSGARIELDRNQHFNQLWGIPFLGPWVRGFLLIPHLIVLFFLSIVVGFLLLVSWIPVLINGRQAKPIVDWMAGFVRWYMRVAAYLALVVSPYPPFSLN